MTQWHPIFDELLRRALRDYYEVQTNMPVGDLPREADIVLVRRASVRKPPFRTLWRRLTRWNVLEFKGRSESARVADVDLLAEVGLGIQRRLQEQEPQTRIERGEMSFWYLANHLGKRFLRGAIELTENLMAAGPGLWHGRVLGRPLWLVSNQDVPIDAESAPVSIVSEQTQDRALELARVIASSDVLWGTYGSLLGALFPQHRKEFEEMAAKHGRRKDEFGTIAKNMLDAISSKELVEGGTARTVVDKIGMDGLLAILTPQQRHELAERTAQEAARTLVDEIGVEGLLAILTPQQQRELARRITSAKK